jgi:hypothetical protein
MTPIGPIASSLSEFNLANSPLSVMGPLSRFLSRLSKRDFGTLSQAWHSQPLSSRLSDPAQDRMQGPRWVQLCDQAAIFEMSNYWLGCGRGHALRSNGMRDPVTALAPCPVDSVGPQMRITRRRKAITIKRTRFWRSAWSGVLLRRSHIPELEIEAEVIDDLHAARDQER